MTISVATYVRVALEDSDEVWELDRGHLRSKPGGTVEHNSVVSELARILVIQLSDQEFVVSPNLSRLRASARSYFVPDLCVIPRDLERRKLREMPNALEVYDEPMPLAVEVWSPSTGDYDVEEKLREYQRRGDLEIWRLHPYERTLTAWRRQPDGVYAEAVYTGGTVTPSALPSVTIEFERLWP